MLVRVWEPMFGVSIDVPFFHLCMHSVECYRCTFRKNHSSERGMIIVSYHAVGSVYPFVPGGMLCMTVSAAIDGSSGGTMDPRSSAWCDIPTVGVDSHAVGSDDSAQHLRTTSALKISCCSCTGLGFQAGIILQRIVRGWSRWVCALLLLTCISCDLMG